MITPIRGGGATTAAPRPVLALWEAARAAAIARDEIPLVILPVPVRLGAGRLYVVHESDVVDLAAELTGRPA